MEWGIKDRCDVSVHALRILNLHTTLFAGDLEVEPGTVVTQRGMQVIEQLRGAGSAKVKAFGFALKARNRVNVELRVPDHGPKDKGTLWVDLLDVSAEFAVFGQMRTCRRI